MAASKVSTDIMGVSKQFHFVLVHGGGHGAWCWRKIVSALEQEGHRVTTMDLNGAGDSPMQPDDISSLEEYNQPLEDIFRQLPENEKVILVGHSLAGFSLTVMSELFPDKIALAVYLCAYMPASGVDLPAVDPSLSLQIELEYNFKVKGGVPTSQSVPEEELRELFYNKCSSEDFAFAIEHIRPVPFVPNLSKPLHWTIENYGSVPKVYIIAENDKAITPAACRLMIKLNPVNEVFTLDGADHSAFDSAPEELKKILVDSAIKYGR